MKMTIISVVPTDMEVSAGRYLNEVYCKDENGRVGLMLLPLADLYLRLHLISR